MTQGPPGRRARESRVSLEQPLASPGPGNRAEPPRKTQAGPTGQLTAGGDTKGRPIRSGPLSFRACSADQGSEDRVFPVRNSPRTLVDGDWMNVNLASGADSEAAPDSVSEEDLARCLKLREGSDPTSLRLSAAEGYLLSRIDGHTPWRVLREIGGLAPDDVDICIEGWIADELIEMGAERAAEPKVAAKEKSRRGGEIDDGCIDPRLELTVEAQRRILEFQNGLDCGYCAILGVESSASAMDIKRAYRELSREFHPDRYFRKEIGEYGPRLEEIFKKVLEAYELLSDPATRVEVQKAEAMEPRSRAEGNACEAGSESGTRAGSTSSGDASPDAGARQAPKAPLTPIERLRQRMPFRIPDSVRNERKQRARSFYDAARTWAENDHPLEAASSIRLAIAFDPHEGLYKRTFAEIQGDVAEGLAKDLLKDSKSWSKRTNFAERLQQCEEALLYRPHDPDLNDTAAQMALQAKDLGLARDYVDRALAHSPDVGRFHRTLALVHHANGDRGHALNEMERAVALDSCDDEAKELLSKWREKPPRAVQGGRS